MENQGIGLILRRVSLVLKIPAPVRREKLFGERKRKMRGANENIVLEREGGSVSTQSYGAICASPQRKKEVRAFIPREEG